MRLHPLDNGCEKGLLFTPQMYEAPERAALATAIVTAGRPFVFVDVGANVGLFSLFVAATAGPDAKIIAVEPEPENLRRLRFNVTANPGLPIAVLPVALDEAPGMVAIEANYRDRGGTRTLPSERGTVEALTLLEALKREGASYVDALKIDVEGAEDRILVPFFRDAPQSLWPRLVIIEDSRASWRVDLFSGFADHGYDIAARTRQNVILQRSSRTGSRSAG
jgi:FkbM family methyltransferase